MQEQVVQMDAVVKRHLAKSARTRYGILKQAQPKLFLFLVATLFDAIQKKKVQLISDAALKEILRQIGKQHHGNIQA